MLYRKVTIYLDPCARVIKYIHNRDVKQAREEWGDSIVVHNRWKFSFYWFKHAMLQKLYDRWPILRPHPDVDPYAVATRVTPLQDHSSMDEALAELNAAIGADHG